MGYHPWGAYGRTAASTPRRVTTMKKPAGAGLMGMVGSQYASEIMLALPL